jgi:NADH:ubiquinone oxidoreductase subunit H
VSLNWFLGSILNMGQEGFALIFLAEYASILFMRLLFCVFFGGCNLDSLIFYIRVTFISYLFIWVRSTYWFPFISKWPQYKIIELLVKTKINTFCLTL